MKKVIAIFVLCAAGLAFAQSPSIAEPAPREHRGFYNSSSFGFALNWFNNSEDRSYNSYNNRIERDIDFYEYYGFSFMLGEFKFGYALGNLVAFHTVFNFAFYMGTVDSYEEHYVVICAENNLCVEKPDLDKYSEDPASGDGYNFRTYLGFGATFYPFRNKTSPLYGAFVGGSVGYTLFGVGGSEVNGNGGIGFELELGKEWWLNDCLSIGFGLGFAHFGLVWNTVESHRSDNVLSLSFRITRG